jgi:hypothetical protein
VLAADKNSHPFPKRKEIPGFGQGGQFTRAFCQQTLETATGLVAEPNAAAGGSRWGQVGLVPEDAIRSVSVVNIAIKNCHAVGLAIQQQGSGRHPEPIESADAATMLPVGMMGSAPCMLSERPAITTSRAKRVAAGWSAKNSTRMGETIDRTKGRIKQAVGVDSSAKCISRLVWEYIWWVPFVGRG